MNRLITLLIAIIIIFTANAQVTNNILPEDIFVNGKFTAQTVNGMRSMKDGEHYTTLENNSKIVKYNYKTGKEVGIVFDITKIKDAPVSSFSEYEFSNDETKILLTTDVKPIYRHSFTAVYYIWNQVTEEFSPLSEKGAQQVATFSPDGERIAFVRDNNIFIKSLKFGTENQVTYDGVKNKIINGIPDWVYEEEFGFNKAIWWSPDSKFLAFVRFDESQVPDFSIQMYAGENPHYEENKLYPGAKTYKYPKAGQKNSEVTVLVHELRSKTNMPVDIGADKNIYIPRLKWTPNANSLLVMRVNRLQNKVDVLLANPFTGDSRPFFSEKNKRYIDEDFYDNFNFLEDGKFVIISERNGWSHLYLFDNNAFELAQLTSGKFDVTKYYGFDKVRKVFYYQAAAESPLRREVYFISQDGKKKGKVSSLQGTNDVIFSANFNYYINIYSNSKTPTLITLHENNKGTQIKILQDNTVLKNALREMKLPQKEFFSFTNSSGVELNGYMIKPVAFNPSGKYPVVMTQYSGPNSQRVADDWGKGIGWEDYLAQEGFLVVCVDPRGTAARGEDFRKITWQQLGKHESDDLVDAAKYLGTLSFVDKQNIAIYGRSYGGFMVLLSMQKGGNLFKAGISVSPVTNFRFYDSVYSERYMGLPEDNAKGYDENAPLSSAGSIKGRLLIIHGTADDNVHVQNTYEFTEKLVQEEVQFDMHIYTNRNHKLNGGYTSMHLYTKMTNFLKEQLK